MPSNKEVWTLPLPPNLAPLQCARALPAASAVARAAARLAAAPIRLSRRGAAAGAQRGQDGGRAGSPGWGGAAGVPQAPFPAQNPLLGRGGAGSHRVRLWPLSGIGSRTAVSPLRRLRDSRTPNSSASTQGHLDGGGEHSCLQGFNCAWTPTYPGAERVWGDCLNRV